MAEHYLHVPDFAKLQSPVHFLSAPAIGDAVQIDAFDEDAFTGVIDLRVRVTPDRVAVVRDSGKPFTAEVLDMEGVSSLTRPDSSTPVFSRPIGELALQRVDGSDFWLVTGEASDSALSTEAVEVLAERIAKFAFVKELESPS